MMKKKTAWYSTDIKTIKKSHSTPELRERFEYLLNLYLDKNYLIAQKLDGRVKRFMLNIQIFKEYYIEGTNILHKGSNMKRISPKIFLTNKFDKEELINGIISLQDFEHLFKIIEDKGIPENITSIANATIRREALDYYGIKKFFKETNSKIIHQDGKNVLLSLRWHKNESPMTMVKVIDSTTKDIYLLRVPPEMKTVKDAIAWTFDMNSNEYYPIKET